jgi:hypothetical protein
MSTPNCIDPATEAAYMACIQALNPLTTAQRMTVLVILVQWYALLGPLPVAAPCSGCLST